MLPDSAAEVMRRAAVASGAHATDNAHVSPPQNNKDLLRQQLLTATKEPSALSAAEKPKHTRNRQKNRWKLKFHHQALPQEYLDHYEQSLQRANAAARKIKQEKMTIDHDNNNISKDGLNIWAQRLAAMHTEAPLAVPASRTSMTHKPLKADDKKRRQAPAIAPTKIITYDDLPYMGEMTLNNSKPRRGRKPKKADICHLIYENYGTVVPGQPTHNGDVKPTITSCNANERTNASKTDLQNKIISSLLERKLSQENRRAPAHRRAPNEPLPAAPPTMPGSLHSDSEPLNLCIRDLRELKIQIRRKFGNIYSSLPDIEDEDAAQGGEQPNAISVIQRNTSISSPTVPTASSSPDLSRSRTAVSPTLSEPASLCWPGLYMHPLALQTQLLYYQRLAAAGQPPTPSRDDDRPPSTPTSASGSDGRGADASPPPAIDNKSKLVLKQISELLDPNVIKEVEVAKRSPEATRAKRASPNEPRQGPVKRKRSAIFIPPMPPKSNSSTPTAEVSICKFKFTGGSKPSLQEKKMLSVDAGGNFRYYSGGGGKATKGTDHLGSDAPVADSPRGGGAPSQASVCNSTAKEDGKKKRKSRKSLQREKLEQTFKEKGFLIQTQQLQSAEGATYCKFRQLRKFTRYLFRSWKDYLPGELEERSAGIAESAPEAEQSPVGGEWV